jgi:hypothetical protein
MCLKSSINLKSYLAKIIHKRYYPNVSKLENGCFSHFIGIPSQDEEKKHFTPLNEFYFEFKSA